MRIEPFEHKNATHAEYAAVNDFWNRMRAERLPDDPPIPLDEQIQRLRSLPPLLDNHVWSAWRDDLSQVVGVGEVSFLRVDQNRHVVDFSIGVLPEYRGRGLARRLLARIVEVPRREDRRLMLAWTTSTIAVGEAFMKRMGARIGQATHINQLDLHDLNRDLLKAWQASAAERASGFDLGVWTEGYPEESIELVVAVFEAMNSAPTDNLEVDDEHWTPAQLRQFEAADRARGRERWTMYARDRKTGRLAGMTEVAWHPNRPEIIDQQMTGVLPEYQGRGLGRWLKAAMLEKILRDRPQVRRIRTGNADSNDAMLKINRELGFKPFQAHCRWQLETEKVLAYLTTAPGSAEHGL